MDAKKNGRIKTEIDDKKIRISTTFEETQRRVTEYDKDDNVDNNALAEMIRLKAEFLSLNKKNIGLTEYCLLKVEKVLLLYAIVMSMERWL